MLRLTIKETDVIGRRITNYRMSSRASIFVKADFIRSTRFRMSVIVTHISLATGLIVYRKTNQSSGVEVRVMN